MIITPLPWTSRPDLLRTFHDLLAKVQTIRGSGYPQHADKWQTYMTWVSDAEHRLHGQVRESSIDSLFRTPRYWILISNPPTGNLLVNVEVEDRAIALKTAIAEFEVETRRWESGGRLVVPDTSFFIESPRKFGDIDYSELLGTKDVPVRLVVPMAVVDELDGLKRHNNKKKRWRAQYSVAVIDRVSRTGQRGVLIKGMASPVRGEVTLEILVDPPGHVRLPITDDEIVDRALAVKSIAGQEVTLLTFDTGHATRGRVAGLDVEKYVEAREADQPDDDDLT